MNLRFGPSCHEAQPAVFTVHPMQVVCTGNRCDAVVMLSEEWNQERAAMRTDDNRALCRLSTVDV